MVRPTIYPRPLGTLRSISDVYWPINGSDSFINECYHPNMPTPTTTKLTLPAGGTLQGFPTLAAQTAACSPASNLLAQAAPLLATMHCQSKVLNLLRPLINIIKALPNLPVRALQKFALAAEDLEPLPFHYHPGRLPPSHPRSHLSRNSRSHLLPQQSQGHPISPHHSPRCPVLLRAHCQSSEPR